MQMFIFSSDVVGLEILAIRECVQTNTSGSKVIQNCKVFKCPKWVITRMSMADFYRKLEHLL